MNNRRERMKSISKPIKRCDPENKKCIEFKNFNKTINNKNIGSKKSGLNLILKFH